MNIDINKIIVFAGEIILIVFNFHNNNNIYKRV